MGCGTMVIRPSGCRILIWLPFWLTFTNPACDNFCKTSLLFMTVFFAHHAQYVNHFYASYAFFLQHAPAIIRLQTGDVDKDLFEIETFMSASFSCAPAEAGAFVVSGKRSPASGRSPERPGCREAGVLEVLRLMPGLWHGGHFLCNILNFHNLSIQCGGGVVHKKVKKIG